jgi:hypothetical protein
LSSLVARAAHATRASGNVAGAKSKVSFLTVLAQEKKPFVEKYFW